MVKISSNCCQYDWYLNCNLLVMLTTGENKGSLQLNFGKNAGIDPEFC